MAILTTITEIFTSLPAIKTRALNAFQVTLDIPKYPPIVFGGGR